MSRRDLVRIGAVACVACCAAPFVGTLAGLTVLGAIGTLLFGAASLVAAGALVLAATAIRRRARRRRITESTPVELQPSPNQAQPF